MTALAERVNQRRSLPAPEICRGIRRAAGLSRRELADFLGVSAASIYAWETGRRHPTGERLDVYLEALRTMQGRDAA